MQTAARFQTVVGKGTENKQKSRKQLQASPRMTCWKLACRHSQDVELGYSDFQPISDWGSVRDLHTRGPREHNRVDRSFSRSLIKGAGSGKVQSFQANGEK